MYPFESLRDVRLFRNLSVPQLYEHAVARREGMLAAEGPLVCRTGQHTGRSPDDKFIVCDAATEREVDWGAVNRPMTARHFALLKEDSAASLAGKDLYVLDCWAGADPSYRIPVRMVNESAWHNLFARNLFIPAGAPHANGSPSAYTLVHAPRFTASPARHGTRSEVVIAINFSERLILIGGTTYAGEVKKAIFTVLNYLLPHRGVLPMHCSANVGPDAAVALFFGLSGTGKTTLSSDPCRGLIGDDEHGWSERGVFNFEGGCYAKTIRLSADAEPQIYSTTRRFGTVLENVILDPATRLLDLDDATITENTRAAYPLHFIENAVAGGCGRHPQSIVMLTADAFGVLPPIARLTPSGAMYHFLSGYTAKVSGTEKGVSDPAATFSPCFGGPFLPLAPARYVQMLGERLRTHRVTTWLVNTGWTGGPFGTGARMAIAHTRAMVNAALEGRLDEAEYRIDPIFNLAIPAECPGVPAEVLQPRHTWRNALDYDASAARLAAMFVANFERYRRMVPRDVLAAGPAPVHA